MRNRLIFLFIFLTAISCKKDMYSGITFEAPIFKDSVYTNPTLFSDTLLTNFAWGMASYKNYIILLAQIDDHMFHLYDKETGEKIKSFGKLGRGPQEILTVSAFSVNEQEETLISYCYSEGIYIFHLDSVINDKAHFMDKINLDQYKRMIFYQAYKCHNGYFLYGRKMKDYQDGARFTLLSKQGKLVKTYNRYPINSYPTSDSINSCSDWINLSLLHSMSPDGSKFAEATQIGAIIETFYIKDKIEPHTLKGYYKPYFLKEKNKPVYTSKTQFGFYYLTSTNNYLYALSFNGSNQNTYPLCEMQVFDWTGNPIKKYKTNKPLLNVCVDEERGKVYALSQSPMKEFCLISFNL